MSIPAFRDDGHLPPGIYAASIGEVSERFGRGSSARERQAELLTRVYEAAGRYESIKRILVWGSFVTSKPEPADLDYSVVVSVGHERALIKEADRRFFSPNAARIYYGTDKNYLVIYDYPLDEYAELVEFLCRTRKGFPRGIVELPIPLQIDGE